MAKPVIFEVRARSTPQAKPEVAEIHGSGKWCLLLQVGLKSFAFNPKTKNFVEISYAQYQDNLQRYPSLEIRRK